MKNSERIVDATGLKCPLPVLLARRALTGSPRIMLIATDPASVLDIPVFCAEAGYRLVSQRQEGLSFTFIIERLANVEKRAND